MNILTKIAIVCVLVIVVLAAAAMLVGEAVSWVSGGFGLAAGVQAGNSLVLDGEWAIGLTALVIVLAIAAWWYTRSQSPWRGGI